MAGSPLVPRAPLVAAGEFGPRLSALRVAEAIARGLRAGGAPAPDLCPLSSEQVRLGGLPTLLPDVDPTEWGAFHWKEPPPPDVLERRAGRPHLTWVFVGPFHAGEGVGTTLLDAAVRALLEMGYAQLASTFLAGNDSSMLWHWRNGFRLLAYPGSKRKTRERLPAAP